MASEGSISDVDLGSILRILLLCEPLSPAMPSKRKLFQACVSDVGALRSLSRVHVTPENGATRKNACSALKCFVTYRTCCLPIFQRKSAPTPLPTLSFYFSFLFREHTNPYSKMIANLVTYGQGKKDFGSVHAGIWLFNVLALLTVSRPGCLLGNSIDTETNLEREIGSLAWNFDSEIDS